MPTDGNGKWRNPLSGSSRKETETKKEKDKSKD
jgi:hypothetical protein